MAPRFKKLFFPLIFISVILFFFCFNLLQQEIFLKKQSSNFNDFAVKAEEKNCEQRIEEKIVKGDSLSPILEPGQTVKIDFNYYNCNEIKKGDIIAFKYSKNIDPLVKIVKGLPGDSFRLEKKESKWSILINDKIIKNSEGNPYVLSEQRQKMLSLYERDYQGKIPSEAFLVLGNKVSGTIDSSFFGLVDKSSILGKVNF